MCKDQDMTIMKPYHPCSQNGYYQSHIGIITNKRPKDLSIGHKRSVPYWDIEGSGNLRGIMMILIAFVNYLRVFMV